MCRVLLERGHARAKAEGLSSNSRRPTQRRCRLPMAASTRLSRPSASCSRPIKIKPPPSSCAFARSAARSGSPTGRRKASSASCSRRLANTCRRRLAQIPRAVGHARRISPRLFGPAALAVKAERAQLQLPLSLARAFPGCVQDLLWPDAQGICGSRRGQAERPYQRPARPHRADESKPPTVPWSCQANIWKSSFRNDDIPCSWTEVGVAGSDAEPPARVARMLADPIRD